MPTSSLFSSVVVASAADVAVLDWCSVRRLIHADDTFLLQAASAQFVDPGEVKQGRVFLDLSS